jgi:LysM repeat protein
MKHQVVFTFIAILIVVAVNVPQAYAEDTGLYIAQANDTRSLGSEPGLDTVIIVRRGDTLYSIARRYGTTVQAIMRTNGLRSSRIYVGQRLIIPGFQPDPVTVDGWVGEIINLPPGSQHAYYFERSDGQDYGIEAVGYTVRYQLKKVRWTGSQIRIWGTVRTDVPSYAGRHIAVERLEVISSGEAEARNLTPLATISASSHLHTDRWGQYQSWMAADGTRGTAWVEGVAGDGVGEWIELRFPRTIEVHSVGLNIGYDKNADIFVKNNRIKRVTLAFSSGEQVELGFDDRRGMQMIPLVRAPGPNIETTFVRVIIEEVFPGWKYDDTCLAEIEVWGKTQ